MISMEHFYVFYFFATFSIGILSLGITVAAALKSREAFIAAYLFCYLAFSLVVGSDMFSAYIRTNMKEDAAAIVSLFQSLSSLGMYLLMIAVPACVLAVCRHAGWKRRIGVFAGISIGTFLFTSFANSIEGLSLEQFETVILVPVMLYGFGYGIRHYRNIPESPQKKFTKKWLILLGCSFVLLAYELLLRGIDIHSSSQGGILLELGQGKTLYPIIYCGFSLLFAAHFLQYYLLPSSGASQENAARPKDSEDAISMERLCESYHLSPREQDVLRLVLRGDSNAQIGEALYISVGTVKAHISKIFQKVGVSRRYELLSRFRDASLLPPEEPES